MGSYADLWVGTVRVASFKNGVPDEFLSAFRDDMMQVVRVPGENYYGDIDYDLQGEGFEPAEFVDLVKFITPGPVMAQRLDLMGFTPQFVMDLLDRELSEWRAWDPDYEPLTAQEWIDALASSEDEPESGPQAWRGR